MSGVSPLEYQFYDEKFVPSGFGLVNNSNLCWFNSLIQLMLGLPALNKVLLDQEYALDNNLFALEYIKIVKLALSENPQKMSISSAQLLNTMIMRARQKGKYLNMGHGQECADEGLILFIELLECPHAEYLFSNVYELIIECKGCNNKVSSIRDKSFRIQMFSRPFQETKAGFCDFIRVHTSEVNFYICECGHKMAKFHRIEKLRMLREIIVVIFNKFFTKEINWFPEELFFKNKEGKYFIYRIAGKIEHTGTRMSGHYWADSLRHSWTRLNDTSVSPSSSTPTANTFIIAYHMTCIRDDAEENNPAHNI